MEFVSFGYDEIAAGEPVPAGSKVKHKKTGEICTVVGDQLGCITSQDGKDYLISVHGKLINTNWEVV